MNGNAKWVIGVLGSIAGLAENSGQRQSTVGSGSGQLAVPTAYCRCLLAYRLCA